LAPKQEIEKEDEEEEEEEEEKVKEKKMKKAPVAKIRPPPSEKKLKRLKTPLVNRHTRPETRASRAAHEKDLANGIFH
jgi:hypothetical protein